MPDEVSQPCPQPLVQPVQDTLGEPDQPQPGIALSLSGGGYRAMLFHLGCLWRLNEFRYLPKLDRISSVSGGSITSGVLAQNWTKLGFDANGFAANFDQQITQPSAQDGQQHHRRAFRVRRIFRGSLRSRRHSTIRNTCSATPRCRTCRTRRASYSTPPACRPVFCGASPSHSWATTRLD